MATTPLLLLPGILNDGRIWDALIQGLPAGRTMAVADTHGADNMAALAASALAGMPAGRFAVAGFSLGGYVALELCRQAPERIAGLALLDSSARADTAEARHNRQRLITSLRDGSTGFAETVDSFAAKLFHPAHADDPRLLQLLRDMARTAGEDGFVRQQTAAMQREDRRDVLATLQVPALIVCGEQDGVTPLEHSEEMARLLPGDVELVRVPRSGHMTTLEQPADVTGPFARWLRRVDAAQPG